MFTLYDLQEQQPLSKSMSDLTSAPLEVLKSLSPSACVFFREQPSNSGTLHSYHASECVSNCLTFTNRPCNIPSTRRSSLSLFARAHRSKTPLRSCLHTRHPQNGLLRTAHAVRLRFHHAVAAHQPERARYARVCGVVYTCV